MKIKILFFLSVLGWQLVKSQVTITGPACVLPGVQYQYLISTTDTVGSGIQISLTNGAFTQTGNTSLNDSLVSYVLVTWNSGASSASISFSSPSGSTSNTINITSLLQPGSIDTAYLQQTINYNAAIASFNCSAANGGSCSPSYSYQWQQSTDNLVWNDITGATNQNFNASVSMAQTTYLRRKVTETTSGSVAYTTTATVYVNPPTGDSTSTGLNIGIKPKIATAVSNTIAQVSGNYNVAFNYVSLTALYRKPNNTTPTLNSL